MNVQCTNRDLPGNTIRENLAFLTNHIQKYIDKSKYEDKYLKIFWSGSAQGNLPENGEPWNDILIDALEKTLLSKMEKKCSPLKAVLTPYQGIVPNPDRTTSQNIKLLSSSNIQSDKGVFVLDETELKHLHLTSKEHNLIKRSYRNSDICSYVVDIPKGQNIFLIYITKKDCIEDYPNIKNHLENYREILQARREVKEGTIPWYSIHWPRDENLFKSPKIVCSNWGNQWQPFALQEAGFYERRDITFFVPEPNTKESLLYFLGVLNSSLIKRWGQEKLKQQGYMKQKLQEQIPIYRINFENHEEVKRHNEIVELVKTIRSQMLKLAGYSIYFESPRLTCLQFNAALPKVIDESIIRNLGSTRVYNIRTHPDIRIEKSIGLDEDNYYLSAVKNPELNLSGTANLRLRSKDGRFILLEGPFSLLELLFNMLNNRKGSSWSIIKESVILPNTIGVFNAEKGKILTDTQNIRTEIQKLQETIDQIVYSLYGLSEGLLRKSPQSHP